MLEPGQQQLQPSRLGVPPRSLCPKLCRGHRLLQALEGWAALALRPVGGAGGAGDKPRALRTAEPLCSGCWHGPPRLGPILLVARSWGALTRFLFSVPRVSTGRPGQLSPRSPGTPRAPARLMPLLSSCHRPWRPVGEGPSQGPHRLRPHWSARPLRPPCLLLSSGPLWRLRPPRGEHPFPRGPAVLPPAPPRCPFGGERPNGTRPAARACSSPRCLSILAAALVALALTTSSCLTLGSLLFPRLSRPGPSPAMSPATRG